MEKKSIPEWMKYDIDNYVKKRVEPGQFLTAVLENNLFESVSRADPESLIHIADLCKYINNKIPSECWGSKDKVSSWLIEKYK